MHYIKNRSLLIVIIALQSLTTNNFLHASTTRLTQPKAPTMITNPDGSQVQTEYGSDGKVTHTTTLNTDKTVTTTRFFSDGSQIISYSDTNSKPTSFTYVDTHGAKKNFDIHALMAWHETGHTLAHMYNYSLSRVNYVTVQPTDLNTDLQKTTGSTDIQFGGAMMPEPTYLAAYTAPELENYIITYLAGGVAEQIAMSQKMLTNPDDIVHFFKDNKYMGDTPAAFNMARQLVMQNPHNLTEQEITQEAKNTFIRLYKKTYQFAQEHKNELTTIAHELLQKKKLSGEDVRAIVNRGKSGNNIMHRRLTSKEEGPLPVSLVGDYSLRGWATPGNERMPALQPQERVNFSGMPPAISTETRYFINGNKAIETLVYNYENRQVQTQFNADGTPRLVIAIDAQKNRTETTFNPDGSSNTITYPTHLKGVSYDDDGRIHSFAKLTPAQLTQLSTNTENQYKQLQEQNARNNALAKKQLSQQQPITPPVTPVANEQQPATPTANEPQLIFNLNGTMTQIKKNADGSVSTELYDNKIYNPKLISRTVVDATGRTTDLTHHYPTGNFTTAKYNTDGSKRIIYDNGNNNRSIKEFNNKNEVISETTEKNDGSHIDKVFNPDKTTSIISFGADFTIQSHAKIRPDGTMNSIRLENPDGTRKSLTFGPDGKTITRSVDWDTTSNITKVNGVTVTDQTPMENFNPPISPALQKALQQEVQNRTAKF